MKPQLRFSYGYIVVVAAFFIMMIGYGLFNIYGVFFKPLITEFGWTRAVTSGGFSIAMIFLGLGGILMGGLTDRFGPRVVLTACGIFLGTGFLLMSQVSAVWQLYLFFGVISGIGISGLWVPLLSAVAKWFVKRRSLMTGIVLSGMSIGVLAAPLVVSRIIAAHGWRTAYIIIGIVVLVALLFASQFLKRPPAQAEPNSSGKGESKDPELAPDIWGFSLGEAAHTKQFWLIMAMFVCFGFPLFSLFVHVVPNAIEQGIPPVTAANVLAIMGGMALIGNFVLGGLGDRIGSRNIFIIGFVVWALMLFWLALAREIWMFYIFAVLFGFTEGGMGPAESPLLADYFGLKAHGLIFGVVDLGFPIGAALGPLMTGYIFDVTGSYQLAFMVCAAVAFFGLILSSILKPPKGAKIKAGHL